MSKDKIKIEEAKNTIVGSSTSAGGNLHIGDQHIVHNIYRSEQNSIPTQKEKKKLVFKLVLLKVVLFSVALVGVKVSIDNLNINFTGDHPVGSIPSTPAVTDKPDENKPEGSRVKKDQSNNPPTTVTEGNHASEKPVSMLSNYIDLTQSPQVAMLNAANREFPAFHKEIKSRFTDQSIRLSDSYFSRAFLQRFGSSVEVLEIAGLREIGLPEKLNCICQISESIKYEPNEVEGVHVVTARGRVHIHILNLKTSKLEQITFTENGAGISEAAALESLEEHLLQSEKLKSINTQQCK